MANLHLSRTKSPLAININNNYTMKAVEPSSSFYTKQGIISYILLFLLITIGPKATSLPIYPPGTRRVTKHWISIITKQLFNSIMIV